MRKLFLLVLMVPALLISCDDTRETRGNGSLRIGPTVDIKTNGQNVGSRATPTTDFSTWFVTLQGTVNRTMAWPTNGLIQDLPSGSYVVKVHSHQEMPAPAFDTQYYFGEEANVTINPGQTTNVNITAEQANAGMFFTYDANLASFDIIPTVTQGTNALVYSGANKEARGYFAPGTAVITLKNGTEDIKIDGANSKSVTLGEKQLWRINLTSDVVENGGINITVSVEVIDTATDEVTFQVGGDGPGGDFTVDDLVGYWDVLETNIYYGGAGWSAAYNDHELWITKVNETTVKIHNVTNIAEGYGLEYGDMGDDIIATVDVDAMTISFAYQEVTPAWPLTGITNTYFCGLWENQFVDNIGRGIENVPIQIVDGKYHIAPATESVVTIDNEPYFCSWAALLFQGSDFAGVSDYFCGTFWTKQEGSRSSVTVSPQRDRVVKDVKNVSFSQVAR